METGKKNFVDQIYHFKGKWEVPSLCGLKIVRKPGKTIVIATNQYDENPGTSISRWSAQLATTICNEFNISPDELIFIEHNPDIHSRLEFYAETFDVVELDRDGDYFVNPAWKRVSREEVEELIA